MSGANARINVYVGTPLDGVEDFLYVDLVIEGVEFTMWKSPTSLENITGQQYLELLGEALNVAKLLSRMDLKIETGDDIIDATEDFNEEIQRNVRALLREI